MDIDSLYQDIAYDIDQAREKMRESSTHISDARDEVVDVTTSSNTDAVNIELALLDVINNAYISYSDMTDSTSNLVGIVRALNNYVINNYDGTLTAYVNSLGWTNSGGEVPYDWAMLSEQAGYDISEWNAEMS